MMSRPGSGEFDTAPAVAEVALGKCVLCGHGGLARFAEGRDYEMRTCANNWTFKHCAGCGHVQLDPRPAVAAIGVIYPPDYYSYTMSETLSAVALKGKELLDRLKLRAILRRLDFRPTSYLDIGCGDGRYLRSVEALTGIGRSSISGLELNQSTVTRLRQGGFNALHGRVETCDAIAPGTISLATMFHVIEHVEDPVAVIAKITTWLEPGGVLAIETPNVDALDARLFARTYWGGYHFPRHWHLFHERTLDSLLRRHGLEPVHVAYQTGHSFWMYSVHHFLRYRLGWVRVSRLFDPMKGLLFLIFFTGLDKVRAAVGLKTSSVLIVARKGGGAEAGRS